MIFFAIPVIIIAFVFLRNLFSASSSNGPRSYGARPDIDSPVYMPMDDGVTLITAQMIQDDAAIGDTHQDGQGFNESNSTDSGHRHNDSRSLDGGQGFNDSNAPDSGHDHSSSTDQGGNDTFWSDPGFGSSPSDASSTSDSSFSSDSSWSSDSSFGGGATDSSCGSSDSF